MNNRVNYGESYLWKSYKRNTNSPISKFRRISVLNASNTVVSGTNKACLLLDQKFPRPFMTVTRKVKPLKHKVSKALTASTSSGLTIIVGQGSVDVSLLRWSSGLHKLCSITVLYLLLDVVMIARRAWLTNGYGSMLCVQLLSVTTLWGKNVWYLKATIC